MNHLIRYGQTGLLFTLSAFLLTAVGALAGAPTASAASAWDSLVGTSPTLIVSESDGSNPENVSSSYGTLIQTACSSMIYNSFITASNATNGTLTLIQDGLGTGYVTMLWSQAGGSLNFTTIGGNHVIQASYVDYKISIIKTGASTYSCSNDFYMTSNVTIAAGGVATKFFYSNYTINYPPGFAGPAIPDSLPSQMAPDWTGNIVNFVGTLSDSNFLTFDDVPFLCNDDLVPVLHWEISDSSGVIDSGTMSASGQIGYNFPRVNESRDYSISGYYDCGDVGPNFSGTGTWNFTVDQYGSLVNTIFEECLKDEFPFVDLPGCIENVFHFANLLSFGTITIGSGWSASTECYNLVIIDDWIHLEDPQVCPQFSSTVRNIVTPFVTFLLGLLSMAFLARSTGKQL